MRRRKRPSKSIHEAANPRPASLGLHDPRSNLRERKKWVLTNQDMSALSCQHLRLCRSLFYLSFHLSKVPLFTWLPTPHASNYLWQCQGKSNTRRRIPPLVSQNSSPYYSPGRTARYKIDWGRPPKTRLLSWKPG